MPRAARTPISRFLSWGFLLAVVAGFMLPAQAAPALRTVFASVDVTDVLAGTFDQQFAVTVTNSDPSAPAAPSLPDPSSGVPDAVLPEVGRVVNFVSITPPVGLVNLDRETGRQQAPLFDLTGDRPQAGLQASWTYQVTPTNKIIFQGGPLLPGQSFTFRFFGDVQRPARDVAGKWSVVTSDDLGRTQVDAPATTTGALNLAVRVLNATDLVKTAPKPALSTVTIGQDNVDFECEIQNHANRDLVVVPTLNGDALDGAPIARPGITIPRNGGSAIVQFLDVTILGPAIDSTDVTCAATSLGAPAEPPAATPIAISNDEILTLTVQTPAVLQIPLTFLPGDIVPGASYAFDMTVAKAGQVAVEEIDFAISFINGASTVSVAVPDLAIGAGGLTYGLTLPSVTFPVSFPNGVVTARLCHSGGLDVNGALIPASVVPAGCLESTDITADDGLPIVKNLKLTPPVNMIDSSDRSLDAATNGKATTISGTVDRVGGTAPCGTCSLVSARIRQFAAPVGTDPAVELDSIDLALTGPNDFASLSAGVVGGTFDGPFHVNAVSARLEIVVQDNSTNPVRRVTALSPLIAVDNVDPTVVSRKVVRSNGESRIVLGLSERVAGTPGAPHFSVSGGVVRHAFRSAHDEITLVMATPLHEDATPTVAFNPACLDEGLANTPLCSRVFDRVGRKLAPNSGVALDRVAPGAIALTKVDGDAGDLQDGFRLFYSNEGTLGTPFEFAGVPSGHTVKVFSDRNGDSKLDVLDNEILSRRINCPGVQPQGVPTTMTCTAVANTVDMSMDENTRMIFVRTVDAAGNLGAQTAYSLTMDHVIPEIANVSRATATTVSALWTEPVFGRDFAADWNVIAVKGVTTQRFQTATVTPNAVRNRYTLAVDDATFDATWTLTAVEYDPPTGVDSYRDRAGNKAVAETVSA